MTGFDTPLAIRVPDDALVLLIGPSGAGKSTFAARHFPPDAVLSSDAFRARVGRSEADQSATDEAFRRLHADADERLAAGRLTVVDATNVEHASRAALLDRGRRHGRPVVAIVLDVPLQEHRSRNARRPGRVVPQRAVRRQQRLFRRALPHLAAEGFDAVHVLTGVAAQDAAEVSIRERDE